MRVENQTSFAPAWLVLLDKQAAEHLIVLLKATYLITEEGRLELARKQEPIRPADEFYGEPGQSSIKYEAELGPVKLATDVALVGSAIAPQPGATEMEVSLRVGPLFKRAWVFGERRWKRGLLGLSPSSPLPFERVPLIYENAYGGKDASPKNPQDHDQEPRNPVGRGFRAKKSQLEFADTPVPNIEEPGRLLRSPGQPAVPQGFGFIGRDWQPRLQYAGTYDQQWMEERMPLLPLNFDARFHNAAHPDLTANGYLRGDEAVEIVGCTRAGRLAFALPGLKPLAEAVVNQTPVPVALNLNTVLLDAEAMKVSLLWKGEINIHRRLPQFSELRYRLG